LNAEHFFSGFFFLSGPSEESEHSDDSGRLYGQLALFG
jgi:hypothetical protein